MCPREAVEAIHVLVSGRVQGVGFRYFVKQTADTFAIAGWVRNLHDGRVEAVLVGPATAMQALLARIRRGPSAARVDEVLTRDASPEERRGAVCPLVLRGTA